MTATNPTQGQPEGASHALRRRRAVLGGTAFATAAGLALAGPIAAALAAGADGKPAVQTSETVKATLDPTGKLGDAFVFSQIEATGKGNVVLQDPTSTSGLRNLDGWGAPSTKGGKATYDFSVDGTKRFRTVADFDKKLPVTVDIASTLNGKKIDHDDLAGKSGKLGVTYTIKNDTAEATEITYPDGQGNDVTESVDIVTPYVGQLVLDLPDTFRNIASNGDRADQAGDGHGGRLVTWTMVLFEPIGQVVQKFGYTADVEDAAIPSAHMQLVPVSPENHPELRFGQDGFASGAQTGRDLTAGASEIDANLLKLQDGASQLLDGLTQLQTGAVQLNDGLAGGVPAAIDGGRKLAKGANDAADGAGQVADGANQVADGNKKLSDGLGALADGAGQLQTGSHTLAAGVSRLALGFEDPESDEDLIDGSQALAGALGLISGGLTQLNSATTGLPAAKVGLQTLRYGIDHPIGAGGATDPGGLYQGLQQIAGGLSNPLCNPLDPTNPANPCGVKEGLTSLDAGLTQIKGGLQLVAGGLDNPLCDPSNPGNPANPCGVKQGVGGVKAGLDDALVANHSIDQLKGAATAAYALSGCPAGPTPPAPPVPPASLVSNCDYIAAIYWGVEDPTAGLRAKTQQASGALGLVLGGLNTQLIPGVNTLITGTTTAQTGLASIRAGVNKLAAGSVAARDGVKNQVLPGIDLLIAGLSSAISGASQLDAGAAKANTGAGDLADGIATAADGVEQLNAGAGQLADGLDQVAAKVPDAVDGSEQLTVGSRKLANGADKLAAGLQDKLAPGATQLSDGLAGLQAAVDGSGQIADGLGQAKAGNVKIVDGAGQLSNQGTKKLVEAGDDTSKHFGKEYAVMQAINAKGVANSMPYGAPKGSDDNRGAYDISIEPVGSASGMGSAGRGLVGLVVLGLGALAATLVRGRFS
jgi:putative membrane protein